MPIHVVDVRQNRETSNPPNQNKAYHYMLLNRLSHLIKSLAIAK